MVMVYDLVNVKLSYFSYLSIKYIFDNIWHYIIYKNIIMCMVVLFILKIIISAYIFTVVSGWFGIVYKTHILHMCLHGLLLLYLHILQHMILSMVTCIIFYEELKDNNIYYIVYGSKATSSCYGCKKYQVHGIEIKDVSS